MNMGQTQAHDNETNWSSSTGQLWKRASSPSSLPSPEFPTTMMELLFSQAAAPATMPLLPKVVRSIDISCHVVQAQTGCRSASSKAYTVLSKCLATSHLGRHTVSAKKTASVLPDLTSVCKSNCITQCTWIKHHRTIFKTL
jgi:hypothetical protein